MIDMYIYQQTPSYKYFAISPPHIFKFKFLKRKNSFLHFIVFIYYY